MCGDESVIRVEDGNKRVDFPERDATDDEEALSLTNDGIHHEVDDET